MTEHEQSFLFVENVNSVEICSEKSLFLFETVYRHSLLTIST